MAYDIIELKDYNVYNDSFLLYRTIWEHITAFTELFNNFSTYVFDKDKNSPTYGQIIGRKLVPITIGPKEKVISVLNTLLGSEKPEIDNTLPKISILWSGISFDPERMRGQNQKRHLFIEYTTENDLQQELNSSITINPDIPIRVDHYDIQSVPYKLEFEVTFWSKYMDDGCQFLENICPFFKPDRQISLKERGVGIEREAKVTLNGITTNFAVDLNEPDKRILQWNLSFTCEINLYRPIYIDQVILKSIIRVGTVGPNRASGESITLWVDGANLQGLDPQVMQRIQEFDQLTSSTASVSGNLSYITVDTWANPQVTFTPLPKVDTNITGLITEDGQYFITENGGQYFITEVDPDLYITGMVSEDGLYFITEGGDYYLITEGIPELDDLTMENGQITINGSPIPVQGNPNAGKLQVVWPEFNDTHNPPGQFEYPVSRHLSADYYNALNPLNPAPVDPGADIEYNLWIEYGSPGGG